jgi:hypothetical protein
LKACVDTRICRKWQKASRSGGVGPRG